MPRHRKTIGPLPLYEGLAVWIEAVHGDDGKLSHIEARVFRPDDEAAEDGLAVEPVTIWENLDETEYIQRYRHHYAYTKDAAEFIEARPRIAALLVEARPALDRAFGPNMPNPIIELPYDPEGGTLYIRLPPNPDALEYFTKGWWLIHCHQAEGSVVFDCDVA
jgi:hypothetical protein